MVYLYTGGEKLIVPLRPRNLATIVSRAHITLYERFVSPIHQIKILFHSYTVNSTQEEGGTTQMAASVWSDK